jgi:hypothetical protein
MLFADQLGFSKNKYFDTLEDLEFRKQFNGNNTDLISKGKIKFAYSETEGTYCKAAKNISAKEFIFNVPKEFIVCGFDIYPFKFELKDVIYPYLAQKYRNNVNETKTKTALYLFAYSLLYHRYANKEKIEAYLTKVGKEYYIKRLTKGQENYLKSLPNTLYTFHMYDIEEIKLAEIIGLPTTQNEVVELFEHVEMFFRNHPLKVKYLLNTGLYLPLDQRSSRFEAPSCFDFFESI